MPASRVRGRCVRGIGAVQVSITANAEQVAASITHAARGVTAKAQAIVVSETALLQTQVKRRANQPRTAARPGNGLTGPRLMTGNYNRSIGRRVGVLHGSVGTNAPQGRRLELGFHGNDALGRHYEQPAYPHFGPALAVRGPKFRAALLAAITPGDTP